MKFTLINGVLTETTTSGPAQWVGEKIQEFADWVVGSEADILVHPVVSFFGQRFDAALAQLNANSTDIITLAMMVCAFCLMVMPGSSGKWIGRIFSVFLFGSMWRVLIS